MVALSIKHLLGAEAGTRSTDEVEIAAPASLFAEEDGILDVTGPLKATAHLIRVEGGFEVALHDLDLVATVECHTCLRPYEQHVYKDATAAVFFGLPNADVEPDFPVDASKARLPLEDWIRQEVLMALPIMQKCSRPDCALPETPEEGPSLPFAGLKDMFQ